MTGKIKWYDAVKGYGFVVGPDQDYFFHVSQLTNRNQTPVPGDLVEFAVEQRHKGPNAVRVRLVTPVGKGASDNG